MQIADVTVDIDDSFGELVDIPPLHVYCRCWVEYDYESNSREIYSKSLEDVEKFTKGKNDLYGMSDGSLAMPVVNPKAVWVGGT